MKKLMTPGQAARHGSSVALEAFLILVVAAALVAAAAIAMKSPPLGAGDAFAARASLVSIAVPDGTFGGDTTATVASTGSTTRLAAISAYWVRVRCVVDADGSTGMVAWERTGADGAATFTLGPTPSWDSGSAVCSADAGTFDAHGRFKVNASTTFAVAG